MDFFARQDRARAQTGQLLGLFALSVTVVVAVLTTVLVLVLSSTSREGASPIGTPEWWLANASTIALCATGVLLVVLVGTAFKLLTLQGGGAVVARSMGGDLVDANTTDPAQRRLLNVVEEMAMASGVPVPAVYLLSEESAINAFAAGHSAADSVVAVTRGTLERLDRAELQGVIAHEFSHILNGDMRLNMRLLGLVGGLFAIAVVGRVLMRGGRGSSRKGGGIVLVGLAMLVLGYIGVAMGRMIQAAISRQREFLADASAVQFTRDTSGLKQALVKIGAAEQGSRLVSHETSEVAHMLFASGLDGLFATHPPLAERIQALDPSFNPEDLEREAARFAGSPSGPSGPSAGADASSAISQFVAQPKLVHLEIAEQIRAALPAGLLVDAGDPLRAVQSLWALLLSDDPSASTRELAVLTTAYPAEMIAGINDRRAVLAALPAAQRMPLLLRLFPALGRRPFEARQSMLELLDRVIRADGAISVGEYSLARLARVHLGEQVSWPSHARLLPAQKLEGELQTVFSVLAQFGHADAETAAAAYARGMARVLAAPRARYQPPADWVPALDAALERLDAMRFSDKSQLVDGLAAVVTHDGRLEVAEAELLRAICGSLHCPLPPFLRGASSADGAIG